MNHIARMRCCSRVWVLGSPSSDIGRQVKKHIAMEEYKKAEAVRKEVVFMTTL